MKDRFTNGFIAGVASGFVMDILNLISYSLNFAQDRYIGFAGVFIFGNKPTNLIEDVTGIFAHLIFTGFLGIVFAYLITKVTSINYLLKGWVFSMLTWFSTYSITVLFKTPQLTKIALGTALSNIITATVFGLLLAEILKRLDKRIKT